jgi:S-adenosylmethionine:tRNA ribosyltransferase-isomerase
MAISTLVSSDARDVPHLDTPLDTPGQGTPDQKTSRARVDALDVLDYTLPPELDAMEPPEARGLARDEVRLLVSHQADDRVTHTRFRDIGTFLRAGDLLVLNTSGTLNAALEVTRADGTPLELHLSTHLGGATWTVELRQTNAKGTIPFRGATAGETLRLPGGATATLEHPYPDAPYAAAARSMTLAKPLATRLWTATLRLPDAYPTHEAYLARYGFPIRYGYVRERWPSAYYQTVYATEMGSAEMPSAGRGFTPELITRLVAKGVQFAPLLLHTGVSSLESDELPYPESYRVPPETAALVRATRRDGRRVIGVGTTVVRALETVTDAAGATSGGEGWTDVVVTPQRGVRAVDGLLTGLHEPHATHLAMLEALAPREHLRLVYAEALRERYLWHEFGDLHLLLP